MHPACVGEAPRLEIGDGDARRLEQSLRGFDGCRDGGSGSYQLFRTLGQLIRGVDCLRTDSYTPGHDRGRASQIGGYRIDCGYCQSIDRWH